MDRLDDPRGGKIESCSTLCPSLVWLALEIELVLLLGGEDGMSSACPSMRKSADGAPNKEKMSSSPPPPSISSFATNHTIPEKWDSSEYDDDHNSVVTSSDNSLYNHLRIESIESTKTSILDEKKIPTHSLSMYLGGWRHLF